MMESRKSKKIKSHVDVLDATRTASPATLSISEAPPQRRDQTPPLPLVGQDSRQHLDGRHVQKPRATRCRSTKNEDGNSFNTGPSSILSPHVSAAQACIESSHVSFSPLSRLPSPGRKTPSGLDQCPGR